MYMYAYGHACICTHVMYVNLHTCTYMYVHNHIFVGSYCFVWGHCALCAAVLWSHFQWEPSHVLCTCTVWAYSCTYMSILPQYVHPSFTIYLCTYACTCTYMYIWYTRMWLHVWTCTCTHMYISNRFVWFIWYMCVLRKLKIHHHIGRTVQTHTCSSTSCFLIFSTIIMRKWMYMYVRM